MAKIYDFKSGELIKPVVSDQEKVSRAVMLGVAALESVARISDPNSGITLLEVEELIMEHSASYGELSWTDQEIAITQTNEILSDNQKAKEN